MVTKITVYATGSFRGDSNLPLLTVVASGQSGDGGVGASKTIVTGAASGRWLHGSGFALDAGGATE